jgi:hypothetical protein
MINTNKMDVYFDYLIRLRNSGATNMFGASPYLQRKFPELTHNEAIHVVGMWMNSFNKDNK